MMPGEGEQVFCGSGGQLFVLLYCTSGSLDGESPMCEHGINLLLIHKEGLCSTHYLLPS